MILPAFAKINLGLEVLRRLPDGYHEIRTLFQWIDLSDRIEFRPAPGGVLRVSGDDASIPWDETNLVHRAAVLLRDKTGIKTGIEITVEKRIPAGGGLGGGSSDAAMTLWGLNALWGLGLTPEDLGRTALALGMDVPYFLTGGLCLGEGRGERLTPLPDLPVRWVVLALPPFPVSTSSIYRALDPAALTSSGKDSKIARFPRTRELVSLTNTLEETIFRFFPELHEMKVFLRDRGASLSLVTGSGAGVFGLFEDRDRAEGCRAALAGRVRTVLVETLTRSRGWNAITAGASPSGKAAGFGPAIRGFESSRPSSGTHRAGRVK